MLVSIRCLSQSAVFETFSYKGENVLADKWTDSNSQFLNPILPGFCPDPSICRVGKDYYLVVSSFSYYPGVPIYHSTDLVSWRQIGHVLNRPSQLKLSEGIGVSSGIYAPDIKYNPHNKRFYLITTGVYAGGNFYVTTDDPKKGHWSEPVFLPEVGGIDPAIFFDEDGKAYIVNNDAPDGEPKYSGHRAIWIREFDWKNNKIIGQQKAIIDGGVDISQKPSWVEGPHLYKINGKYYLMCAEGGTGPAHREVIFVSDSPMGPFQPCPINPILTQKDLPANREYPVNCVGHADLVQTEAGDWHAVFLGTRDYKYGHNNTGRETFLLPVSWDSGQPVILPVSEKVPLVVPMTEEMKRLHRKAKAGDDFYAPSVLWNKSGLAKETVVLRNPTVQRYQIDENTGFLNLIPAEGLEKKKHPALILRRINSQVFNVSTSFAYIPTSEQDFAGLIVFQDEAHNIRAGKSINEEGETVLLLQVFKGGKLHGGYELIVPEEYRTAKVNLRIEASKAHTYVFSYAYGTSNSWQQLGEAVDTTILSTKMAGGFTGNLVGIYATNGR